MTVFLKLLWFSFIAFLPLWFGVIAGVYMTILEKMGKLDDQEGENMSDVQIMVAELVEEICDKHCKYNETITQEGCSYCKEHEGECYLDKLLSVMGLKGD